MTSATPTRDLPEASAESPSGEGSGMWPLDLAFAILGSMVVGLVFRLLRFDDPRWIYNAWTYTLGIPTILVMASMFARAFASEVVERSIQIGFLLSVIAHLLLMLLAVNVVLFAGMWPDTSGEIARQLIDASRGSQYTEWPQTQDRGQPDYLKPVVSELTQPTKASVDPSNSVDSPLEIVNESVEASVRERGEITRADGSTSRDEPEIASEAQPLARPERDLAKAIETRTIEIPAEPTRQIPEPNPAMDPIQEQASRLDISRNDTVKPFDTNASPSGSWLPEMDLLNNALRRSSPQMPQRAEVATRDDPFPSSDRWSQSQPRTPSVSREIPRLQGASRSIQLPVEGGSQDGATVGAPVEGTGTSASGAMLDRTSNAVRESRGQSGVDSGSLPARSADAGLAIEPSIGALAGRSISPISPSGTRIDLPTTDVSPTPLDIGRFRRRPSADNFKKTQVAVPAPAFKQRMRRNEEAMNKDLQAMGPLGPKTEEAIERGLEFLAKYQRPDGSWRLEDFEDQPRLRSDTAATALALLSFQGAGYSHEQFKYQDTCRRAIQWLIENQRTDGDLYRPMDEGSDRNAWIYSHAIASLALCEAYGMTQDVSIRRGAQRSIDFLVSSQDPVAGGWRYSPRMGSDTSVTGWAMMALKSAELAGLNVPPKAYLGITKWLSGAEASAQERHLYRYNWQANTPEAIHGRVPTPVMTSVGLLMRFYLGWRRTTPDMQRGTDWILEHPPSIGTVDAPQRDTYYWYYASQVMFHMGGDRWRTWHSTLYPILIESQETDGKYSGSWNPTGEVPDLWGPFAGRLYVTTMNLLSLEVTYRHLPIYEATAQ